MQHAVGHRSVPNSAIHKTPLLPHHLLCVILQQDGLGADTVVDNHAVTLILARRGHSGLEASSALVLTIGVAATVAVAVQINFV
jgi:hypothetical protein